MLATCLHEMVLQWFLLVRANKLYHRNMYYDWNICTPHQELLPQGHSQTLRKHVATHGASAHSARMQQIQTNKRTRKISLALMKVNGLPIQAPVTDTAKCAISNSTFVMFVYAQISIFISASVVRESLYVLLIAN